MGHRVAVMQPYFLPYLGYWRLIAAVDTFVLYDDVAYIRGGWINRNRMGDPQAPAWLTLPVSTASPHRRINEIDLVPDRGWRRKVINHVRHTYARAPQGRAVMPIFETLLGGAQGNLSDFLTYSIRSLAKHLRVRVELLRSSELPLPPGLRGQDRVIAVCRELDATEYVNLSGGRELYEHHAFRRHGLELSFLPSLEDHPPPEPIRLRQYLSILDGLMMFEPSELRQALHDTGLADLAG